MATKTKKKAIKRTVKIDSVAAELRRIYRANGNRLYPPHVIKAAEDPDNVLHSHFVWDDSKAANEYRLIQARHLISRVKIVTPASSTENRKVRAYHALRSDQSGYRHLRDCMSSPEIMAALVEQFAGDLDRLRERYESIKDTARARKVFAVIEEFVSGSKEAA